jgi:hypothetical protein
MSSLPKLIARFTPQVWLDDYAVDVNPEGEQEWDGCIVVDVGGGWSSGRHK